MRLLIFAQLLLAVLPGLLGCLLIFILRWHDPTRDLPPAETGPSADLMRWTLGLGALALFAVSVFYFVTSSIALWCLKPPGSAAETAPRAAGKPARARSHPRS